MRVFPLILGQLTYHFLFLISSPPLVLAEDAIKAALKDYRLKQEAESEATPTAAASAATWKLNPQTDCTCTHTPHMSHAYTLPTPPEIMLSTYQLLKWYFISHAVECFSTYCKHFAHTCSLKINKLKSRSSLHCMQWSECVHLLANTYYSSDNNIFEGE